MSTMDGRNGVRMRASHPLHWICLFLSAILPGIFLPSCSFGRSERPGIDSKFHDYSELDVIYSEWAVRYPHLVELRIVRDSQDTEESHTIPALVLSDKSVMAESEPRIQLVGAMHGNEELSTEILVVLVEYLLSEYCSGNPSIKSLLDNTELHILPVANPDGFRSGSRFNTAQVDLNRNFPWSWTELGASGLSPGDQWETRALMQDALEKAYTLSVSLHTGSFGISRLWDYTGELGWSWNGSSIAYTREYFTEKLLPIKGAVDTLGEGYRRLLPETYAGDFFNREGYDWYPAYGTFQDWLYGAAGIPAFTLEIDTRQDFRMNNTDPEVIAEVWSIHKSALSNLLDSVLETTGGLLRDASTGEPVYGEITFSSVQDPGSRTIAPLEPQVMALSARSDREAGSFHAYVPEGIYSLTTTASGYVDAGPFMATITPNGANGLGTILLNPIQ